MTSPRLRVATHDDIPVIRGLWAAFDEEIPDPAGDDETWEEESAELDASLEREVVLLAEVEGEVVGTVWSSPPRGGRAHIELAYVLPPHRRCGVTTLLTEALLERLTEQGVETVTLDVVVGNAAAEATWDALGFVPIEQKMLRRLD
jgi:ribosomal protein S18 acetylase RimI-like enzyme